MDANEREQNAYKIKTKSTNIYSQLGRIKYPNPIIKKDIIEKNKLR